MEPAAQDLKLYIRAKECLGVAVKTMGKYHAPVEGYYVCVGLELNGHPQEIWSGGRHLKFKTPEEAIEWGYEQFAIAFCRMLCHEDEWDHYKINS